MDIQAVKNDTMGSIIPVHKDCESPCVVETAYEALPNALPSIFSLQAQSAAQQARKIFWHLRETSYVSDSTTKDGFKCRDAGYYGNDNDVDDNDILIRTFLDGPKKNKQEIYVNGYVKYESTVIEPHKNYTIHYYDFGKVITYQNKQVISLIQLSIL